MFAFPNLMIWRSHPHFEDRSLCNPCMIPLSTTSVLPRATCSSRDVPEDDCCSSSCLAMFCRRCARSSSIVVDSGMGNGVG
jgi:hypothetical protein